MLVLWDVDLTLVRTLGAGRAALDAALSQLYGSEGLTGGIRFDGRTDYGIFTEILQVRGLADGNIEGEYGRLADAYIELLPRMLHAKQGEILPGVLAALDRLEAEGVANGLATGNLERGARVKLSHHGLWQRFVAGAYGDCQPIRADVIREAVQNIATASGTEPDPARAIVIGDTPLDVEAAHMAGTRCLAVATGSYTVADLEASGAEFALPDLSDTERVAEIILG